MFLFSTHFLLSQEPSLFVFELEISQQLNVSWKLHKT